MKTWIEKSQQKQTFSGLEKNIGFVEFPHLGIVATKHAPISVTHKEKETRQAVLGVSGTSGGKTVYNSNKNPDKGLPKKQRVSSSYVNQSSHHSNFGHEAQHGVFGELNQTFGAKVHARAIEHVLSGVSPKQHTLIELMNPQFKNHKPHQIKEEKIAYMHNFLQDNKRREAGFEAFEAQIKGKLSFKGKHRIIHEMKRAWLSMKRSAQEFSVEHIKKFSP